jgi:hypothetical protein
MRSSELLKKSGGFFLCFSLLALCKGVDACDCTHTAFDTVLVKKSGAPIIQTVHFDVSGPVFPTIHGRCQSPSGWARRRQIFLRK